MRAVKGLHILLFIISLYINQVFLYLLGTVQQTCTINNWLFCIVPYVFTSEAHCTYISTLYTTNMFHTLLADFLDPRKLHRAHTWTACTTSTVNKGYCHKHNSIIYQKRWIWLYDTSLVYSFITHQSRYTWDSILLNHS